MNVLLRSTRISRYWLFYHCFSQILFIHFYFQVTGGTKGSEERDIMFGKLFGYISLMRADLLKEKTETTENLADRIFNLHNKKSWLQELTIETFLTFLTHANENLQQFLFAKLEAFFIVPLEEMNVHQLLFFLGMQYLAKTNKSVGKLWKNLLKTHSLQEFKIDNLETVLEALLSSSKTFPKVRNSRTIYFLCIFLNFFVLLDSQNMGILTRINFSFVSGTGISLYVSVF
jgi:hypothetical protein